jgi:hypothetical protein
VQEISADELEELELMRISSPSTMDIRRQKSVQFLGILNPARVGILARSDKETIIFGSALSDTEREWVYKTILLVVTAPNR